MNPKKKVIDTSASIDFLYNSPSIYLSIFYLFFVGCAKLTDPTSGDGRLDWPPLLIPISASQFD